MGKTVLLGEGGQRISLLETYLYRGRLLEGVALYTPDCEAAAGSAEKLRGARLGIPTNALALFKMPESDPIFVAYRAALEEMRKAGAEIIEANFAMAERWGNSTSENRLLFADLLTSPRFLGAADG